MPQQYTWFQNRSPTRVRPDTFYNLLSIRQLKQAKACPYPTVPEVHGKQDDDHDGLDSGRSLSITLQSERVLLTVSTKFEVNHAEKM